MERGLPLNTHNRFTHTLLAASAGLALMGAANLASAAPAPLVVQPNFGAVANNDSQFAVPVNVNYSSRSDGEWTRDGDTAIWTLVIQLKGAVTASFSAVDVNLPVGATMSITGNDGVAHKMNAKWVQQGKLWTNIVPGDTLSFEARMPQTSASRFDLTVNQVQAGFRSLRAKAVGDVINATCKIPGGSRSVAYIITNNSAACSATLVNDAAQDYKGYLLTAGHCAGLGETPSDAQLISSAPSVRAEFFQTTACGAAPAQVAYPDQLVGAVHRAHAQDTWLIELTGTLPAGVQFAGFNTANSIPASGYGVHHANNLRQQYVSYGQFSATSGSLGTFWGANWVDGSTGNGASGSGLVVAGQVVGTLLGGSGSQYGSYSPLFYAASALSPYIGSSAGSAELPGPPTLTFSASPSSVAYGASTTLSWSATNSNSCTASGDWSGAKAATSGAESLTLTNPSGSASLTKNFTLDCTGASGTVSKSASVTVGPKPASAVITISASPASVTRDSGKSNITWTVSGATACTASGEWSGAKSANGGSEQVGPFASTGTKTFTLACTGAGGDDSKSTTVSVVPPAPPAVTLTLGKNAIVTGGETTTLGYSVTGATSCTASGDWSGSKSASGGSEQVGPYNTAGNKSFTLTCTGPGGDGSKSASLSVTTAPAPTISLSANPGTLFLNRSGTLSWSSANANSCTASGDWSGSKATSGSGSIGPYSAVGSKTFTLDCTGFGGTVSRSTTVTVTAPPAPTVNIAASLGQITAGSDTSTLNWSSTNADSCTASGDWSGSKSASGSQAIGPYATAGTRTFALKCSNVTGTGSASVAVGVGNAPPTLSLTASKSTISATEKATLNWNGTRLSSCTASGDWSGSKTTSGSEAVGPLSTGAHNFVLTCNTEDNGTLNKSVTVTVSPDVSMSLTVNPTQVTIGESAMLTWASQNASACTAANGWTGSKATSGTEKVGPYTTTGSRTFSLTCASSTGTATKTATLAVVPAPAPTVSISSTRTSVAVGETFGITFASTHAKTCTASGNPQWSGSKPTTGGSAQFSFNTAGSQSFALSCTGDGGTVSKSVTVQIGTASTAAPKVTISVGQSTVPAGQTVNLQWSSTDSDTCLATGAWSGSQPKSGTRAVGPFSTNGDRVFTLACTGPGGIDTQSATVSVTGGETGEVFTVGTSEVNTGDSAKLTWDFADVTTCNASSTPSDPAWSGAKPASGTALVSPQNEGTQNYTLACTGNGVTRSKTVSVHATAPASDGKGGGGGGAFGQISLAVLGLLGLIRRSIKIRYSRKLISQ